MGKSAAIVKQWLDNPKRVADLFNGLVFEGKQVSFSKLIDAPFFRLNAAF